MTGVQTSASLVRSTANDIGIQLQVTVLIPAYNEEQAIIRVLEEVSAVMESTNYRYEVLVVDDASTDATAQLAEEFSVTCWESPVRVIRRPFNAGAGAARKTGIRAARGEFVVMLDADGSYAASSIPELLKYIPDYDQVNGARIGEAGTYPWLRGPAKWAIRKLACYLTGKQIPDLNTGLKVVKRDVVNRFLWVIPDGFSCVTTMTLAFLSNGYAVKYVEVPYRSRIGISKFHPIKDTASYISTVLRMVMYFQPLKVFFPLAFMSMVAGLAKGVWSFRVTGSLQESDVIILVGSFLTAMLGLLAEIIVAHHRR